MGCGGPGARTRPGPRQRGTWLLAQAINQHLPATVKVLAVQRVNRSFDARERCGERTYHYWLPASAIGLAMDGVILPDSPLPDYPLKPALRGISSLSQVSTAPTVCRLSSGRHSASAAS